MDVNIGVTQETMDALNGLAVQLGTTSEYLWGTMVAQVKVNAYSSIARLSMTVILGGTLLALAYFLYRKCIINHDVENCSRCARRAGHSIIYAHDWEGPAILLVVFTALIAIVLVINIYSSIGTIFQLLNPEYYATKQILSLMK